LTLIAIVKLGHGLGGMSLGLLATQMLMYAAFLISLRRLYSGLKLSPRLMTREAGREIWLYARQVVSGLLSARFLQSAIPSLIARLLPIRNVTYYTVTAKVLDYAGEGIGRVGLITGPRAMDWMARGQREEVLSLAEYGNKYCLTLWLFFATLLLVYGKPLFRVWVSAEFADNAAPLLPIMLFGYTLWLGQFTSGAILMGIGRYGEYSASLLAEAILTLLGWVIVLPRFGLAAGVAVSSAMFFLNRCVNLSRIFAKEFQVDQVAFLWRVYRMPMALGLLEVAGLWAMQSSVLPGRNWRELIAVGIAHSVTYCAAAFWLVLGHDHRALVLERVQQKWREFGYGGQVWRSRNL
jgi:O-antigen/teichoic acid export membrane protein